MSGVLCCGVACLCARCAVCLSVCVCSVRTQISRGTKEEKIARFSATVQISCGSRGQTACVKHIFQIEFPHVSHFRNAWTISLGFSPLLLCHACFIWLCRSHQEQERRSIRTVVMLGPMLACFHNFGMNAAAQRSIHRRTHGGSA